MNRALESRFTEAETLSDADQARLAEYVGDFIESAKEADQNDTDMKDPNYRAYVVDALTEGEADISAGRFSPFQEALGATLETFKAKHGL